MAPLPTPAETAVAEFRRRRASWQKACRASASSSGAVGRITPGAEPTAAAEHNLRLWLAICAAAGCGQGPDPLPELEWLRGTAIYPPGATPPPMLACEIAPRAEWQAELLRARDVALARAQAAAGGSADQHAALRDLADKERGLRAWTLTILATHLGCPAHAEPLPERQGGSCSEAIARKEAA